MTPAKRAHVVMAVNVMRALVKSLGETNVLTIARYAALVEKRPMNVPKDDTPIFAENYAKRGITPPSDAVIVSVRAANCLHEEFGRMPNVGEVRRLSEADLLRIPNLGLVSMREIVDKIGYEYRLYPDDMKEF